jgi:hypothetical protein
MQVTVGIPDDLAERLKGQGHDLDELVTSLLESSTNAVGDQKPRLTLDEMFERLAVHSPKVPQLPDEA